MVVRHLEVLAIGDLLVRALAIQADLYRRMSKRPSNRPPLAEQKQYEKLVGQLLREQKAALVHYLATIRRFTKR